jgi:putative transposase
MSWVSQDEMLSINKQCELACIPRSSWYYEPLRKSEENLLNMRLIDEQFVKTPFYEVPRMCWMLRQQGYKVDEKRVSRLMLLMGIKAIYPKRNLSRPEPGHKIYPYLLRGVKVERPDLSQQISPIFE